MAVTVTAVVPTIGASPLLADCLSALRAQELDGDGELEIVLVRQGSAVPEGSPGETTGDGAGHAPAGTVDHEIRLPRNLGFAAATNRGIEAARGPYVATVNDDVIVMPGWLRALIGALEGEPRAAAAQGVNLQAPATDRSDRSDTGSGQAAGEPPGLLRQPHRVDGWGLAWNRAVQAVQLGRDATPPDPCERPSEVFGVSATAAVYRREALLAVARGGEAALDVPEGGAETAEVFDSRFESYYEDADLACRLRAAGFLALSVPAARAVHAGSLTGGRLGSRRWRLLYGNRYAVAASLLGRGLWPRLPRMVARDAVDLVRALAHGELRKALGIAGGWGRALRLLPSFCHRGAPTAVRPGEGAS